MCQLLSVFFHVANCGRRTLGGTCDSVRLRAQPHTVCVLESEKAELREEFFSR